MKKDLVVAHLKNAIRKLENVEGNPDILASVDEGGYGEGFRLLSNFDILVHLDGEDEDVLITIEVGFED